MVMRRGPRRRTAWIDTLIDESGGSTAQDLASLLGNLTKTESQGYTLTRCIIHLWLSATAIPASVGITRVDLGIGLASEESFAAGVVPDPSVAPDRPINDWVWRDTAIVRTNGDTTVWDAAPQLLYDIRSRRRIEDGELFLVIDVNSINGTAFTVNTVGLIRCLFLLP